MISSLGSKTSKTRIVEYPHRKVQKGHNVRVFPISNWTELDIWNYLCNINIELPNLYFFYDRECIKFQDKLVGHVKVYSTRRKGEVVIEKKGDIELWRYDLYCSCASGLALH